jgi:hypothetical protein
MMKCNTCKQKFQALDVFPKTWNLLFVKIVF